MLLWIDFYDFFIKECILIFFMNEKKKKKKKKIFIPYNVYDPKPFLIFYSEFRKLFL